MGFSLKQRVETIEGLKATEFDVLIIGGGITAAGIAHQASASGLKTALIEMQDFSEGTSSRSTKLVHGGIRYLKQFDIDVVSETVKERAVIQQIAPHIPIPSMMVMPIYDEAGAPFSMLEIETAMELYDNLAGVKDGQWQHRVLSREETMDLLPNINHDKLIGGGLYLDYRNNDSRLVIEHLKSAHKNQAVLASYVKAIDVVYKDERIIGVKVEDQLTKEIFIVRSKVVVNATGPWSDLVRKLDDVDHTPEQMRLTKGVHLVVSQEKLPVKQPVYFDTGLGDGRMLFVLPQRNKTYFGTTDTDYQGDLSQPLPTQEDVDYLINIINTHFPEARITLNDIESSWAGLRPLLGNADVDYNGNRRQSVDDESFNMLDELFAAYRENRKTRTEIEQSLLQMNLFKQNNSPSNLSRGSQLSISPSGMITIAGGKLTDFRQMANDVMEAVREHLLNHQINIPAIDSATLKVSGGEFEVEDYDQAINEQLELFKSLDLSAEGAMWLVKLFGGNTSALLKNLDKANDYLTKYHLPLHLVLALIYCIDEEAVYDIGDFLVRRTSLLLFQLHEVEEFVDGLLAVLAEELNLTTEEINQQSQKIKVEIENKRLGYLRNNMA